MTPTLTTPEHITRGEFDMRLKRLEENKEYKEELLKLRISGIEQLLEERFAKLEAIIGRDTARQEASLTELRGEVKAINARIDGLDKRVDDLQQTQNRWFTLLGFLVTLVPIAVTLIQKFVK